MTTSVRKKTRKAPPERDRVYGVDGDKHDGLPDRRRTKANLATAMTPFHSERSYSRVMTGRAALPRGRRKDRYFRFLAIDLRKDEIIDSNSS